MQEQVNIFFIFCKKRCAIVSRAWSIHEMGGEQTEKRPNRIAPQLGADAPNTRQRT